MKKMLVIICIFLLAITALTFFLVLDKLTGKEISIDSISEGAVIKVDGIEFERIKSSLSTLGGDLSSIPYYFGDVKKYINESVPIYLCGNSYLSVIKSDYSSIIVISSKVNDNYEPEGIIDFGKLYDTEMIEKIRPGENFKEKYSEYDTTLISPSLISIANNEPHTILLTLDYYYIIYLNNDFIVTGIEPFENMYLNEIFELINLR